MEYAIQGPLSIRYAVTLTPLRSSAPRRVTCTSDRFHPDSPAVPSTIAEVVGAKSSTVTGRTAWLVKPPESMTSRTTEYTEPATEYRCCAIFAVVQAVSNVPSPSQSHRTERRSTGSSESRDADASKRNIVPVVPTAGVTEKLAVGARFATRAMSGYRSWLSASMTYGVSPTPSGSGQTSCAGPLQRSTPAKSDQ